MDYARSSDLHIAYFHHLESMLQLVLCCKHAFKIWDNIHKNFNAHMKARVRHIRVELKSVKKVNSSIIEYVRRVKTIANLLLVVGNVVSEQDQIDSILDGLPEVYNLFVMQMYGTTEPICLYDVEALLYV